MDKRNLGSAWPFPLFFNTLCAENYPARDSSSSPRGLASLRTHSCTVFLPSFRSLYRRPPLGGLTSRSGGVRLATAAAKAATTVLILQSHNCLLSSNLARYCCHSAPFDTRSFFFFNRRANCQLQAVDSQMQNKQSIKRAKFVTQYIFFTSF